MTMKQEFIHRVVATVSIAGLAGGSGLLGCETNPYTHRSQLMLMPESQEMQMGAQAYVQVLHDPKVKISTDPREVEPVKRVAARIIEAAKSSKYAKIAQQFDWEVSVIKDDKTMNAFALPGGKIAVYTGIFPVAKNEAGSDIVGLGFMRTLALSSHTAASMNPRPTISDCCSPRRPAMIHMKPSTSGNAWNRFRKGSPLSSCPRIRAMAHASSNWKVK